MFDIRVILLFVLLPFGSHSLPEPQGSDETTELVLEPSFMGSLGKIFPACEGFPISETAEPVADNPFAILEETTEDSVTEILLKMETTNTTGPNDVYTRGGMFKILKYAIEIMPNLPHTYKGIVKMEIKALHDTNLITFLKSKQISLTQARFALSKNMVFWEKMNIQPPCSIKIFPHDDLTVIGFTKESGELFANSTYRIDIDFVGDFSVKNDEFHESSYRTKNKETEDFYAIGVFNGTKKYPLISLYGIDENVPTIINILPFGDYTGFSSTVGQTSPERVDIFMSRFVQLSSVKSYVLYVPEIPQVDTESCLALAAGQAVVENTMKFFHPMPQKINVKCVLLPNMEPNLDLIDGLIYYEGANTIHGAPLMDLLMLDPGIVRGKKSFGTFAPSAVAVHEALLMVAKVNIQQCFGPNWKQAIANKEELWLHFALLEFLKYRQIQDIYPEYRSMDIMYLDYVQPYLWRDRYGLGQFPTTEDEKVFYNNTKYVSMFRMYYDFCKETHLRVDINNSPFLAAFIKDFRVTVTNTTDTIEMLDIRLSRSIDKLTDSNTSKWISYKENYPIVHIEMIKTLHVLSLSQRFSNGTPSNWGVPMTLQEFMDNDDLNTTHILLKDSSTVSHNLFNRKGSSWIITNPGQSVMYRVHYAPYLSNQIFARLLEPNFGGIHYMNRAQLIDDAMEMVINGGNTPYPVLSLFEYMRDETELLPWSVACRNLKFLYQKITKPDMRIAFQMFVASLVEPLYERLGPTDRGNAGESLSVKKLRNIAIELACLAGNEECIENVDSEVEKVTSDPYRELEVNTRNAICCTALRRRSEKFFKLVVSRIATNATALEHLDWRNIDVDLNRIKDNDELDFYARCISCCTVHQFLPNYMITFYQLEGKKNELRLQESFRENVDFTTTQLMGDFGFAAVHRDTTYNMLYMAATYRWLLIAANQVDGDLEAVGIRNIIDPARVKHKIINLTLPKGGFLTAEQIKFLRQVTEQMSNLTKQFDDTFYRRLLTFIEDETSQLMNEQLNTGV